MKDQIKSYLQRLNHGEALENVQADFVRECKDVDPSAIMQAEQELLREGTSIEELQRLCDVHSALFHGSTTEEKITNAEKTAAPSLAAQKLHSKDLKDQRLSAAAALIQISGHPLQTFTLENAALEKLIARARQALENNGISNELLDELRQIAIHYARTIESLDTMVADSLKEKLFISGLSTEQEIHSFQQYFGDFSFSMNALVFSIPEKTTFSKEISLKELLYEQLLQLSQKTIILYQAENYIYCLMESVSGLSDLLSNCLKHIRELHNQSVKVGISNPFQDISYTQHASTQAKRRLSAGYRIDGVYVFTHTYSSRAVRSLISIQDLDNLQRALLSGNGQNADRILETIHQTISHSEQNSVELRQMFFSLRSVYATVCNQFSLEAERNGETRYHAPILPNDLDEYDLDSVYEVFRSLNIELQQQYEIVMARTARSLGTDILAYIDQNYTDPNLCAGVIADVFHISEKYVFQLLKSCCNETLNDRILRLRIDEGIRLLTTTDLTITTIAKKTGFSSSNTMYKAFMRVKGISPSSYRGKEI